MIAELWLGEGRAFFDLGTLLAYRRGEYDPAKQLAAVEPDIAELVMHMIQRAPGAHRAGCRHQLGGLYALQGWIAQDWLSSRHTM